MSNLKPCPFCGRTPSPIANTDPADYEVAHKKGCRLFNTSRKDLVFHFQVAAWNRRQPCLRCARMLKVIETASEHDHADGDSSDCKLCEAISSVLDGPVNKPKQMHAPSKD